MSADKYVWTNYIQGPRWVNLEDVIGVYALAYQCEVVKFETQKHFFSQVAYFTVAGPEPNLTAMQDDIMTNPNVRVK